MRWSWAVVGVAAAVAPISRLSAQQGASDEIIALVESGRLDGTRRPDLGAYAAPLAAFYGARQDAPAWLSGGVVSPGAMTLIGALARARDEGLVPGDYDVARLQRMIRESGEGGWSDSARARFDVLLSVALMRFVNDVHQGRLRNNPFSHHAREDSPAHDPAVVAGRFLEGESLESLVAEVRPRFAQYAGLLRQLRHYRGLAAGAPAVRLPWRRPVSPGGRYSALAELQRRLVLLGDLDPDSAGRRDSSYAGPVVDGVRRFQLRHALAVDGVLGGETVTELRASLDQRITQIELALERLRWLPPIGAQRFVVVNVPAFELFAFDSAGGTGAPSLTMKVVTGKSFDTRTPVMLDQLRYIEFWPYWNVPQSILKEEILPALVEAPGYLRASRMEIVGRRDTVLGDTLTPELLAGLQEGRLRVRQRPGPNNSVGLVKFAFPNRLNVYLHGTPDTSAFAMTRRDLSHGCIRLEAPGRMAEWVLAGQAGWGRGEIDRAMADSVSIRVDLERPVGVLLYYTTAASFPDGTIRFYRDIYGHDEALLSQLRRRG